MTRWCVLTHGGAATPSSEADGCEAAARAAAEILKNGGDALGAALAATRWLEDDPRYNAGTGSNLRLDGATIQMDAAVMASDLRFGAVACIERVRHPIDVAAAVMDETPHILLAGDGATAFARRLGMADYDPATDRARNKYARALADLARRGDGLFADDAQPWRGGVLARAWNFPGAPPACDTVGAVVRDGRGGFCATASTGGTVYMLRGRVGDSPLIGCGLYAGPAGAVACTGVGEHIARRLLAKTVYDWLQAGFAPKEAAARAIALFDASVDVGVLVADARDCAIAANRDMAAAELAAG